MYLVLLAHLLNVPKTASAENKKHQDRTAVSIETDTEITIFGCDKFTEESAWR